MSPRLIVLLAALIPAVRLLAADVPAAQKPLLEKSTVLAAGEAGYVSYRIPCLAVTSKGTLLAACEARRTRGDWGAIDLLTCRSTDGGRTWAPPTKVEQPAGPHLKTPVATRQKLGQPNEVTNNNPLLIADEASGMVHLLFCQEYFRCYYQRSDDDGQTFSKPIEITSAFAPFRERYDWKVLAVGPGHGLRLRSGRLIVPVWLSTGTGGHAHRPSVVATIYSDDSGKTWLAGEIVAGEADALVNPSESMAVELADGRVLMGLRNESPQHRRAFSTSTSGIASWSKPEFTDSLVEPICLASFCRLSWPTGGGKSRLLFANPNNLERLDGKAAPGKSRDRVNLTVRLSYDEAQTWPISKTLEAGPSGYSDLATGADGTIYCLYETANELRNVGTPTLVLARFNLEWLTDGQDHWSGKP